MSIEGRSAGSGASDMTTQEFLEQMRALGVRLWFEGERMRVSAPVGTLDPEHQRQLAERKAALRELLGRQSASAGESDPETGADEAAATAGTEERQYPVSWAQRQLWFIDQVSPGNPAYILSAAARFDGAVDIDRLQQAIDDVVRRQSGLRTVFSRVDSEPVQVVRPFQPIKLEVEDISGLAGESRNAEALRIRRAEAERPFDLAAGPLLRTKLLVLGADRFMLLFSMHHIVSDNWSLGIFLRELREHYAARVEDRQAACEPLRLQYSDYAERERALLDGPEMERLLGYWRRKLSGAPAVIDLPTDRPRPPRRSHVGGVVALALPKGLSEQLRALARRERATLYMVLHAVFATLLSRYSGQTDIVVGTPVANRHIPEYERIIGLCVSTLAIRSDLSGECSARELVARVRETVLQAQANQELPFAKLVEVLKPERSTAHTPVFQVVFALQNTPNSGDFEPLGGGAMYDLSLFVWDAPEGIRGGFEYSADLFDPETIERMAAHFRTLSEGFAADPERQVSTMPILAQDEHDRLVVEWNLTGSAYPRDASIPELLHAVAAARPDAIALETTDTASEFFPASTLTYAGLSAAARGLAELLRERGVNGDAPVGLYADRSIGSVVALLAILEAGSSYVPLDTGNPESRTREIVADARLQLVLAPRSLASRLAHLGVDVITLENAWGAASQGRQPVPPQPQTGLPGARADDLAYVMYTSGTTGRPKGVCVTHRNVVRLVRDTNYADFGVGEVVLHFAPLAFDASTFEIWGALLNGGRVVVCPPRLPTAGALAEVLRNRGVTTLWLTSGFFHHMVEKELATLAGVRQVLAGGDVLSVPHVQRLLDAKRDGAVVNGYGPTENTTFTCCHRMFPGDRLGDTVPIGRPISNTRVYVLDRHGAPVPIGVAGELHAAGDGVARGYLNDPDGTRSKFVPDPFVRREKATMYRTGDLVRWRADGTIDFLGRIDRQVKVRGFRIELQEIEDVLRKCSRVRDCAVLARRDSSGSNVLIGYVVPDSGLTIDQAELRRGMSASLPEYMIPSAFVSLGSLPLTVNGKLDRSALPEPSATLTAAVVEPRTLLETQLLAIWQHVLGHSGFGIRDNFFDLGGHSMAAVRMFAQIERVFGTRLPISALFRAPTVERLAEGLEREGFRSPWESLVAIQPEGKRQPLFLVPGIGGNVAGYAELARYLGADQPVYGLQSRGLDGRETPFERIEPMAEHFLREIRRVQPKGPYHLVGACFGGAVAYEIAQQLRDAGEEVAFLMLLETWPPQYGAMVGTLVRRSNTLRFLFDAAFRNLVQIGRTPLAEWPSVLRAQARTIAEIFRRRDVYRGDRAAMYVDRVSTSNERAFRRYRPRQYGGTIVLVLAAARTVRSVADPRLFWGKLAGGRYTRFDIPARDSGLALKSPYVETLAAFIENQLSGRTANAENPVTEAPAVRLTQAVRS